MSSRAATRRMACVLIALVDVERDRVDLEQRFCLALARPLQPRLLRPQRLGEQVVASSSVSARRLRLLQQLGSLSACPSRSKRSTGGRCGL